MSEYILKGTEFGYIEGSSPVPIAQIYNIGNLETNVGETEVTDMADDYDQFLPTTKNISDFTFDCNYDSELHDGLNLEGVVKTFYVKYRSGVERQFPGFINKWGFGGGTSKDKHTLGGSVKINGPITDPNA
jgi:hypothetical protein